MSVRRSVQIRTRLPLQRMRGERGASHGRTGGGGARREVQNEARGEEAIEVVGNDRVRDLLREAGGTKAEIRAAAELRTRLLPPVYPGMEGGGERVELRAGSREGLPHLQDGKLPRYTERHVRKGQQHEGGTAREIQKQARVHPVQTLQPRQRRVPLRRQLHVRAHRRTGKSHQRWRGERRGDPREPRRRES